MYAFCSPAACSLMPLLLLAVLYLAPLLLLMPQLRDFWNFQQKQSQTIVSALAQNKLL